MKRPIESDYISQVAYTRALEAYCDEQAQIIQSYLEKDNSKQEQCTYPNCDYPCMNLPDCQKTEDLYELAVKADNGGQP